jgi:GNAT superfamily N-acetyltransferase
MTPDGAPTVVPANHVSCDDLAAIFGPRGQPAKCLCQRMRLPHAEWHALPVTARAERLRAQANCGRPEAATTGGLVARLDATPVGWCAVGPRSNFLRLLQPQSTVPWASRAEDRSDATVWAVTCFVTRAGFRRRGISRALARAAVGFARDRGARAVEGYPMLTRPGEDVPWGEIHVGSRSIFAGAGFTEVSRAALRRVVMRVDFAGP